MLPPKDSLHVLTFSKAPSLLRSLFLYYSLQFSLILVPEISIAGKKPHLHFAVPYVSKYILLLLKNPLDQNSKLIPQVCILHEFQLLHPHRTTPLYLFSTKHLLLFLHYCAVHIMQSLMVPFASQFYFFYKILLLEHSFALICHTAFHNMPLHCSNMKMFLHLIFHILFPYRLDLNDNPNKLFFLFSFQYIQGCQ